MPTPTVVMIAGPNGSGKSTLAPRVLAGALGVVEFVNADTIARGLSAFNPDGAALSAGRVMLQRLDALEADRQSFAFETTAASRSFVSRIHRLKAEGYHFLLAYVWVDAPDLSVRRVAVRVSLGGHNVPEDTIRRRYVRGFRNFYDLYRPLADEWQFYDNSAPANAILVAAGVRDEPPRIFGDSTWQKAMKILTEPPQNQEKNRT